MDLSPHLPGRSPHPRHGFAIVGRVPQAFRHARLGLTDVLILHRLL